MRYLIFNLSALLLILAGHQSDAQLLSIPNDTIIWSVDAMVDANSDSAISYHCAFKTFGGSSRILWSQKEGQYDMEFNIQSQEGTWTDPDTFGEIVFHATYQQWSGTITFSKTNEGQRIRLNFLVDGQNAIPGIFKVNQVNKEL
jgi:hypothetical protein